MKNFTLVCVHSLYTCSFMADLKLGLAFFRLILHYPAWLTTSHSWATIEPGWLELDNFNLFTTTSLNNIASHVYSLLSREQVAHSNELSGLPFVNIATQGEMKGINFLSSWCFAGTCRF